MATVTLTIDGKEITVEQGTTILRAAKQLGVWIPHYCYHPGLSIAGNCRICLVEVEKMPKLQTSCSTNCGNGMVVRTNTSRVGEARRGVLELMLTNHPIDCPICDQAGECKLQDYYMELGLHQSRFKFSKVHKPKVRQFPPHIAFDAERCIMCSRCVRFCAEVTGTNELVFQKRGAKVEITTFDPQGTVDNGYAGNLHEICPVGALTSSDFRFQKRVWWMKPHSSVCPGCSTGCNIRIDEEKGVVYRFRSRENMKVNKWWICDEGRYNYKYINAADRLAGPRLKGGKSVALSEAIKTVAARLLAASGTGRIAGIASARLTNEELFLFRKLIKDVLGGGRIDFRIDDSWKKVEEREDKLLKRADKNPNTRGALALEMSGAEDARQILAKAAEGEIDVLYILGADEWEKAGLTEDLKAARAKTPFIVMHSFGETPVLEFADVVLASATFAEKEGTFTNFEGRVQKISRAIRPVKSAKTDLDILIALFSLLRPEDAKIANAAAAFEWMASEVKAFAGMKYGTLPAEGALIGS